MKITGPHVIIAIAIAIAATMFGMHVVERVQESKATVMVRAQAADANCIEYGSHDGIDISVCTLPSSPSKDRYVSVYGSGPWQVFPLKAPPAPAAQTAAKAPAPAPVDAGAGSGSGQGSGKGSGSGSAKK